MQFKLNLIQKKLIIKKFNLLTGEFNMLKSYKIQIGNEMR
jgi:hypothetical protein